MPFIFPSLSYNQEKMEILHDETWQINDYINFSLLHISNSSHAFSFKEEGEENIHFFLNYFYKINKLQTILINFYSSTNYYIYIYINS